MDPTGQHKKTRTAKLAWEERFELGEVRFRIPPEAQLCAASVVTIAELLAQLPPGGRVGELEIGGREGVQPRRDRRAGRGAAGTAVATWPACGQKPVARGNAPKKCSQLLRVRGKSGTS